VGVIESMKLPSEVRSHCTGVIAEVLIEDGVPVEFDQPLFVLLGRPGPSPEVEG
jgi:acetyl-CoA carboxylase biotin carboxyl carrier protein